MSKHSVIGCPFTPDEIIKTFLRDCHSRLLAPGAQRLATSEAAELVKLAEVDTGLALLWSVYAFEVICPCGGNLQTFYDSAREARALCAERGAPVPCLPSMGTLLCQVL